MQLLRSSQAATSDRSRCTQATTCSHTEGLVAGGIPAHFRTTCSPKPDKHSREVPSVPIQSQCFTICRFRFAKGHPPVQPLLITAVFKHANDQGKVAAKMVSLVFTRLVLTNELHLPLGLEVERVFKVRRRARAGASEGMRNQAGFGSAAHLTHCWVG